MVKHVIDDVEDLRRIDEHPGDEGVLAEQLEAIKLIRQDLQDRSSTFPSYFYPNSSAVKSLWRTNFR